MTLGMLVLSLLPIYGVMLCVHHPFYSSLSSILYILHSCHVVPIVSVKHLYITNILFIE